MVTFVVLPKYYPYLSIRKSLLFIRNRLNSLRFYYSDIFIFIIGPFDNNQPSVKFEVLKGACKNILKFVFDIEAKYLYALLYRNSNFHT
jgi:hypothetical protein